MNAQILALDVANATSSVGETVGALTGRWELLVGAALLIIGAFIVLHLLKNLVANAVMGVVALLVAKFVFGIAIPLNGITILVTLLGGLGGVAALFIAFFLGWL
jgi:hypothetical protein